MQMEQGSQEAAGYRWTFAQAQFDEARWELSVNGLSVELERKPLELLAHLLRHAGEVLTKDELLESVWTGRIVVEAALTNAVGKLRRAIGDDAQRVIVTVPRVGYRLDGPVSRKAVQALPPASMLAAGDAVPRRPNYRLVDRLARNEDSEVWRAEQPKTHEVRVFKFSLDGARLSSLKREVTLSRLLRDALGERDDLVRVLDWDFEHLPFFIESEFGGVSLDTWFQQHGQAADRAQRIALMAETADAVASAHEVGVLHKDLKPANLLVHGTRDDWHPRLTDFGSGRVLDAGRLEALGITQLGLTQTQSITSDSNTGTPLYLAPEVIAGRSPSIKSDLYALGVMLYQLLVGDFRRPLAPGWEADIDDALLRRDIADFADGDPDKRPASARELAERLRTLDARRVKHDLDHAVQARIAASERKLALSHARRPWIAAAMLLLAAGTIGSLFYAQRAQQARDAETLARRAADASLVTVNTLNEFLTKDLIASANPRNNQGEQITVGAAIDKAEQTLKVRFAGDPGNEGTIRLALARSYDGLSEVSKASHQYGQAGNLLENAYGPLDSRALDARLGEAHTQIGLGKMAEAKTAFDTLESRLSRGDVQLPKVRFGIEQGRAVLAERQGDYKAAAASYRKQLVLLDTVPGATEAQKWKARSTLGFARLSLGETAPATKMIAEALRMQERLLGPRHGDTMNTRQSYIQALIQNERSDEALAETERLLADKLATLGPDKPDIANIHVFKGSIFTVQKKFPAAAAEYQQAEDIFARTLGPQSPFVFYMLQYRAENLRWAGASAEAAGIMRQGLRGATATLGDPTAALSDYVMVLALAHLDQGDVRAAQALLPLVHEHDDAVAIDADSARKGKLALLNAGFAHSRGNDAEARVRLREALLAFPEKSDYWNEVASRLSGAPAE